MSKCLAWAAVWCGGLALLVTNGQASDFALDVVSANHVSGALSKADGQAIHGARFRVEVVPEGERDVVACTEDVDATGQYTVRLPYPGRYVMRAFAALPGPGRYDRVEMEPVGGAILAATFTAPAPVKDFRLRAPGLHR